MPLSKEPVGDLAANCLGKPKRPTKTNKDGRSLLSRVTQSYSHDLGVIFFPLVARKWKHLFFELFFTSSAGWTLHARTFVRLSSSIVLYFCVSFSPSFFCFEYLSLVPIFAALIGDNRREKAELRERMCDHPHMMPLADFIRTSDLLGIALMLQWKEGLLINAATYKKHYLSKSYRPFVSTFFGTSKFPKYELSSVFPTREHDPFLSKSLFSESRSSELM